MMIKMVDCAVRNCGWCVLARSEHMFLIIDLEVGKVHLYGGDGNEGDGNEMLGGWMMMMIVKKIVNFFSQNGPDPPQPSPNPLGEFVPRLPHT